MRVLPLLASCLVACAADSDGTNVIVPAEGASTASDANATWEVRPSRDEARLVERSDATPASGCTPGGRSGRTITFASAHITETHQRTVAYRWDREALASLRVSDSEVEHRSFDFETLSGAFGVDAAGAAGADDGEADFVVAPNTFGVVYAQSQQIEKSADIVYRTPSGASAVVGRAVLTDWRWTFGLATGSSCSPLPAAPALF